MGRGGGRGGSGAAVGRRRRRTYLQSTGDSRSISKTPCLVRPRGPVPVARGQEASFTRFGDDDCLLFCSKNNRGSTYLLESYYSSLPEHGANSLQRES